MHLLKFANYTEINLVTFILCTMQVFKLLRTFEKKIENRKKKERKIAPLQVDTAGEENQTVLSLVA